MKRHSPLKRKAELIRGAPLRNRGTKARRDLVEMNEAERDMGPRGCRLRAAEKTYPLILRDPLHECGGQMQRHHVLPRSRGGENTAENLIWLCSAAHAWVHGHPNQAREMGLYR